MDYTYSYLIADLALMLVWFAFFCIRADLRREMLIMSGLFGVAGLFVQPLYMTDWWQPLTITGTAIGIEDFIFGVAIGGISAVAYEVVYKKRFRRRKIAQTESVIDTYVFVGSVLLCAALFFGLFHFVELSSFISSIISLSVSILIMWSRRPDLIINSLASGILLVFFGFLWFWVPELITPGWVEKYWLHENLLGVMIMTAPLEDFIWGLFAGMFIGPLYEFWHEQKLYPLK